jgi:putative nucleotidyltransferase with HDIG domain
MADRSADAEERTEAYRQVLAAVQQYLSCEELAIPSLPDVAVRVLGSGSDKSANAQTLADIISQDAALAVCVLKIAASAARRPLQRISSLQHALAWLGIDEVANIAFTLALQGKMLDVKGQQRKARRLWRHSLASALWARQLARMLARDTGVCYLCGLLHNIGKAVTLGAVHEVARREGILLGTEDYDRLVNAFHHDIGLQVVHAWCLPEPVPSVIARWQDYLSAGLVQWESNVVNLAHLFADFTLHEATSFKRDELIDAPPYRHLGLGGAEAARLFETAGLIDAELDCYLAP